MPYCPPPQLDFQASASPHKKYYDMDKTINVPVTIIRSKHK